MKEDPDWILVGYFRFKESDEQGVIGEVISNFTPGYAHPSDVPVYRRRGETKSTRDLDLRCENGSV